MEKLNKTNDKLTEKAFSRLLWTSILGVLACIVCLCSGTFAWFNANSSSADNEIKSADVTDIKVTLSDGTTTLAELDIDNPSTLTLGPGTYTVTLFLPNDSASGYLLMSTGGTKYHSDCIVRHSVAEGKTVSFTLSLTETRTVTFTPRWGIYSGDPDVADGGVLNLN